MTSTMTTGTIGGRKIPNWYYGVGAGVLALGYFLYSKNKKAKTTAATPATTATAATAVPAVVPATNPSPNDFSAVLDQLAALQGAASTATGTATTATNPLTNYSSQVYTPGQVTTGGNGIAQGLTVLGGYEPAGGAAGSLVGTDGHTYQFLNTYQQAVAARAAGDKFYIETAPGVFSPEPAGQYAGAGWLQVS